MLIFGIFAVIVMVLLGYGMMKAEKAYKEAYHSNGSLESLSYLAGIVGVAMECTFSAIVGNVTDRPLNGFIAALVFALCFTIGACLPRIAEIAANVIEDYMEQERAFELGPCPCGCTNSDDHCVVKESTSSIL